ncbi:hypothetical protein GCM10009691_12000 [Brevibacterium picturae]|uniref:Uncharacterized protein n=1 Tax=Brevibacterium picturae TaxID=260553 RepID=A0ABP4M711_9MICO
MGDARSQAQVKGAGTTADGRLGLMDLHGQTCPSHGDRGGHAVGAGSDDDGIYLSVAHGVSLGERGDTTIARTDYLRDAQSVYPGVRMPLIAG